MTPLRHEVALRIFAVLAYVLVAQVVFPTNGVNVDKHSLLEDINAVLRDTWFQRWFVTDALDSAIVGNERFQEALRHSGRVEPAARAVIRDPEVDPEKKTMAIRMMQCLPPDRYLAFVRFVFEEAQASRCPPTLLADALYPGAHWGPGIALQYKDRRVEGLLNEIDAASLGNQRVNDRISSIRDGSYANYVAHLQETGNRVPPVQCEE